MGAGTAAAGLLKALSSSKAVKAAGSFAKGMKSMEETEKSGGFDKLQQGMGTIQGLMSTFDPLLVPMQVLTATIGAATMDTTVGLMQTMLEQMEKPGVKNFIQLFTDLINVMTTAVGWLADAIGTIVNVLGMESFWRRDTSDPLQDPSQHQYLGDGAQYDPPPAPEPIFDPNDPDSWRYF